MNSVMKKIWLAFPAAALLMLQGCQEPRPAAKKRLPSSADLGAQNNCTSKSNCDRLTPQCSGASVSESDARDSNGFITNCNISSSYGGSRQWGWYLSNTRASNIDEDTLPDSNRFTPGNTVYFRDIKLADRSRKSASINIWVRDISRCELYLGKNGRCQQSGQIADYDSEVVVDIRIEKDQRTGGYGGSLDLEYRNEAEYLSKCRQAITQHNSTIASRNSSAQQINNNQGQSYSTGDALIQTGRTLDNTIDGGWGDALGGAVSVIGAFQKANDKPDLLVDYEDFLDPTDRKDCEKIMGKYEDPYEKELENTKRALEHEREMDALRDSFQ